VDFIIGGSYQGKFSYVKENYSFSDEEIFYGEETQIELLAEKKILKDLHLLVRRWMLEGNDLEELEQRICSAQYEVIITNEIGAGIVPIDRFERDYRELTGRICCNIAKNAKHVIRIVMGIGVFLKGDNV